MKSVEYIRSKKVPNYAESGTSSEYIKKSGLVEEDFAPD